MSARILAFDKRLIVILMALVVACLVVIAPNAAFAQDDADNVASAEFVSNDLVADESAGDTSVDAEGEQLGDEFEDDVASDDGQEGGDDASGQNDQGIVVDESDDAPTNDGSVGVESALVNDDVDALDVDENAVDDANESADAEADDSEPVEAITEEAPEAEEVIASDSDQTTTPEAEQNPAELATAAAVASTPAKVKTAAKRVVANVKVGWYSLKTALNAAFYVQAKGSKSKNGTAIILKKLNASTGQAFRLVKVGNYYRVMCGTGYKSRIHVSENGKVTLVRSGSYNTLFTLMQEDGGYRLVNLATGKALAISKDKAGANVSLVAQKSVEGKKSQTFIFEERNGLLLDGIYSVRTVLTGKRALSPYKGKLKKNANTALTNYKGKMYQKWQIKAVAGQANTYTIENIATGYRLTGTSGKPAKVRVASDKYNQWWTATGLNGKVVFVNTGTGKALQLYNGASAAGTLTTCVDKNNAKKQRWTLKKVNPLGTGIYEFDLAANKGLAMEIPESSVAQNAAVKTWDDINTSNQRWYYDAPSKTLTNVNSGKVLTVKGSAVDGAVAVQANTKNESTQQWSFTYVGGGKFKIVSVANNSLALDAAGTTAGSAVKLTKKANSNTQAWRIKQSKGNVTTYINLGFSLEQMAQWQKSGNTYLSGYTISYIKSVLDPDNGSKYKFVDLRKSTGVSAAVLDKFINRYGSNGKMKGLGKAFVEAAKTCKINETYLLAHAILESDWGRSELASGYKYKGGYIDGKYYKKGTYYNFFGIGAYDSSPLSGGRKLAIINGWNTPAKAVTGAAKWISGNYIYATNFSASDRYPQPTLYAMKWDLARTKSIKQYGWHQYATSTTWADSIGNLMGQIFVAANSNPALTYIIPKYKK